MTDRKRIITGKNGFTLVELAIVIVIIGLIIGGIMVGRDLIKSSTIRSQISQLEGFDFAVSVFKQRYGYLPGDIANPADFGLNAGIISAYCNANNVRGDGIVQDRNGNYPAQWTNCEPLYFFMHLRDAGLIKDLPEKYIGAVAGCLLGNTTSPQYIGCHFPAAKIGIGGFTATTTANMRLGYFLGITNWDPLVSNPYALTTSSTGPTVAPNDAYQLDVKMDDGTPLKGKIKSVIRPATADTVANNCLVSVAANSYNLTKTDPACNLMIESSGN